MFEITSQVAMPVELQEKGYSVHEDGHIVELRHHGEILASWSCSAEGLKAKHIVGKAWIHYYEHNHHNLECRQGAE